jgi:hypothetical protein
VARATPYGKTETTLSDNGSRHVTAMTGSIGTARGRYDASPRLVLSVFANRDLRDDPQ